MDRALTKAELAEVGRHFIIGLQPSPLLTDHDKQLLSVLRPTGVALFRPNFLRNVSYDEWLATYRRLITDVRECTERADTIICMDHEGGLVHRPPSPITRFGKAEQWAGVSGWVGRAMGEELRSLGVSLNLAPVLDVADVGANPALNGRMFGTSPEVVLRASVDFISGLQSASVLACPKHFPGHSGTSIDPHSALPIINTSKAELEQRDLRPFAAAIELGVEAIMLAHAMYPAIDPEMPTFMSTLIVDGLLRQQMQFTGVIITDDIGMHASSTAFLNDQALVKAIYAGVDLILLCSYWTDTLRAITLVSGIIEACRHSKRLQHWRERSVDRLAKFIDAAPMNEVAKLSESVLSDHKSRGFLFTA